MQINPSIFKAYDIRGIYPEDLNEETAYQIGRAFADFVESKELIVGRDIRESGPQLHDALVRGIMDQGVTVRDIGLAGTDMFYFACGSMNLPGINVTASHNPREFNGFKMVKKMPDLVSGEKMRDKVLSGKFRDASEKGKTEDVDIKQAYAKKILSLADTSKISKGLKIVVDPGNGMGGPAFDLVYKDLSVEVVRMFFEPDGTFPNHGGDPLKEENRKDLEARVISEGADLGFTFDTDADRFFAVDANGNYVPSDYLGALVAQYLIQKNGKGSVVHDAIIGWAVRDLVVKAGGKPVISKVGHVFIKAKMDETKAVFGIEKSGHYYLPDFYFAESAVGMSLIVLEMLGFYGKKLDELVAPLRKKYYMIEQENYEVKDPDAVIARVKERYASECEISELDGVSVIAENWHANIRKLNTEPVVRLNVEALDDKKLMEQKRDEFLKLIQK